MVEKSEKEKETQEAPQADPLDAGIVEVATASGSKEGFSFRAPVPGETYVVDGGDAATSIDLVRYTSADIVFRDGGLTVDMGGNQSFSIGYLNVDRIQFGDVNATVLTDDYSRTAFEGTELFIDGDRAFVVSIEGPGSADWNYDRKNQALSVVDTKNTKGNTTIIVRALSGTGLILDSFTVDKRVGSLVSDVDIGTLTFIGNGRIDSIAIADGSGAIDTLHVTECQFNHDVTVSGNVTRWGFHDNIDRRADIHVTGDAGTISIRGEVHHRAKLRIDGDLGSFRVEDFKGRLTVAGDLDTVESKNGIRGKITAHGVVGPFSLDDGAGTVVSHEFTAPTTVTLDDGKYSIETNEIPSDSDPDAGFRFGTPVPGETYVIRGGEGSECIDLTGFRSSDASFGNGSVTVNMGGGQSFSIEYSNVGQIRFGDVTATVLSGDHHEDAFVESRAFIDGDKAFMLSVEGRGFIGWDYDSRKDTLSISNTDHTQASTRILIEDLNGTSLNLDPVTVNGRVGSLVSNVNIGTLALSENGRVDSIAVRNGSGTIDTLRVTKHHFDHDFAVDGNVTFLEFDDDINRSADIHVTGDVGSITIGGEVHDRVSFNIEGDLGSLTAEEFRGELTVQGNLNTVASENGIRGKIRAHGVLGPFSLLDGEGTTISHDFSGSTTITWNDGNYSTEPNEPAPAKPETHTVAPTIFSRPDQTVNEGDPVTLEAPTRGSEHPSFSYTWTQTGGTPVTLTGGSTATPSFVAPKVLFDEDLVFQIAMSDGGKRTTDMVTVRVLAGDGSTAVEEVVSPVAPTWNPEEDGTRATANYDAETDRDESVVFEEDGPAVDAGPDQTVKEGESVSLLVVDTELEGEGLEYSWTQSRGTPITFASSGAGASFTVPKLIADEDLEFRATVTDGVETGANTVTIHVQTDEDAPGAEVAAVRTVSPGEQVMLTHGIPGSESLTTNWTQIGGPSVELGTGSTTSFVAPSVPQKEDLVFQITVSDGATVVTDTVTIKVWNASAPFDVTVTERLKANVGASIVLSAAGLGPDPAVLQYAWHQIAGIPVVLEGENTDSPSFVVPPGSGGARLLFKVEVSAGDQMTTRSVLVEVLDGPGDGEPEVDPKAASPKRLARRPGKKVAARTKASKPQKPKGLKKIWKDLRSRVGPGRI